MKKSFLTAAGLISTFVPLVAMISCGNTAQDQIGIENKTTDETTVIPSLGVSAVKGSQATIAGSESSYATDVALGSIASDAHEQPPMWWGYENSSSLLDRRAGDEYLSRRTTGQPKTSYAAFMNAFWNFTPETQNFVGEDGHSATDPLRGGPGFTYSMADPDLNYFWGEGVDQKFNQATVRDIRPRIYGEKLKDSQSTFAIYHQMNSLTGLDGNMDLGMLPGRTNNQNYLSGNWNYAELVSVWRGGIKLPSGPEIDVAHRNGVPILGTVLLQGTPWQNADYARLMDPGTDGSYPGAKGLVEVADYYGFDGWMINWEGRPSVSPGIIDEVNPDAGFLEAWRRYAHAPSDKDHPSPLHRKFGYYHKPQATSGYTGYEPYQSEVSQQSDYFAYVQGHADRNRIGQWAQSRPRLMTGYGSDIYHGNLGVNWPEDGFADVVKTQGMAYELGLHPDSDRIPAAPPTIGDRSAENETSLWMWSYGQTDVKTDEQIYNSYARDPRYLDDYDHFSASDAFQERTAILGRNNWTTTFDWGSGKAFSLWGSDNLASSLVGSNITGWSNWEMQSFQPTYKWIIDIYDHDGTQLDWPLSVNGDHEVIRRINVNTNNVAPDAWFGGTTIDYSGTLNQGQSFDNKLFASAIPLEAGDSFTIKVKNTDLIANDDIDLNLATWTTDGAVSLPSDSDHDGYIDGEVTNLNTTAFGEALRPGAPAEHNANYQSTFNALAQRRFNELGNIAPVDDTTTTYQYYLKDSSWNFARNKHIIEPTAKKTIGTSGWTELTYDLSSLSGKTLVDFGINAKAKSDHVDFSNLRLGSMHFQAHESQALPRVTMDHFNTSRVWNLPTEKTARISWNSDFYDVDQSTSHWAEKMDQRSQIRDYIVYYADAAWNLNTVAWIGANPVAYLKNIDKEKTTQNIVVMAIDNDYQVVGQQSITLKL